MGSGSPSAYMLWAILSCLFLSFLIVHLWLYDRFNCLRWNSGRQPGAFKRVMTFSYLASLPLLICFSVAMTVAKYQEGYILLNDGRIIPRPFSQWSSANKSHLLPLLFCFTFSWAFELVTHLEELTFWLFLLHQGPGKRDWFHSWEFRIWYLGSIAAILGMPLTTILARHQIDTTLPWILLVGSLAGTTTTIIFLYVIFRFPKFLEYVKAEGADPDVVVRLTSFYQLNCLRVVFRFLFTLPLLLIGVDAIKGPYPIVNSAFAIDFLLMLGGIGCCVSSACTLLIFFPRSVAQESGYHIKVISPNTSVKPPTSPPPQHIYYHDHLHDGDMSNPISVLGYGSATSPPPSAQRMHTFQFPEGELYPTQYDHRYHDRLRRYSTDTGNISLPLTDSDTESIAMSSHPVHLPGAQALHLKPPYGNGHPVAKSFSQPGHCRTTSNANSGTVKSDDTVWDGQLSYAGSSTARRHSDGPLIYSRNGKITRVDEDRQVPSRELLQAPAHAASPLHPYLINFHSPIDLLDRRDEQRPVSAV